MTTANPGSPEAAPSGRGVVLFIALAFGFSWLVALGVWRADLMNPAAPSPLAAPALFLFMCGPAVAALICTSLFDRGRRRLALGFRWPWNRWLPIAWLAPAAIVLVSLAITLALSGRAYQPLEIALEQALRATGRDPAEIGVSLETAAAVQLVFAFTLGPLINWPLMLSEELGWRGWLWDRWSRLGFWPNALATGFVWGVWHAPIIALGHNYPGMPVAGPFLMIGWCMLLTPMLHLVRERGGSVWHACLFHGTINALAGLTIVMIADPSMPWRGIVGIGGGIALALAVLATWLIRRRLGPPST